MTKEKEEEGFRVTDKRGFREESDGKAPEFSGKAEDKAAGPQDSPPGPPIDFTSYVLSYYTQGIVFLGKVPNPYTNKKEEDVEAARHIIDLLSMLEQKTKGNLTNEEKQLLENVLYELRMEFMAKTNKIKY